MKHFSKVLCLPAETKVSSPMGEVRIDSIEPGTEVFGYDEKTSSRITDTVLKVARSLHDKCAKVVFENGAIFFITLDHPIYVVSKGWSVICMNDEKCVYGVKTQQLVVGDVCIHYTQGTITLVKVVSIDIMPCAEYLYCVSTAKSHSFFANGILVRDVNIDFLTQEQLEANQVEVRG